MNAKPLFVCLVVLWCCSLSRAQFPQGNTPNNFEGQPAPQNFNADGPWNRDVIAYRVSASGEVENTTVFERAGVPTIARLTDDRLIVAHQHFPENDRENFDKVAVHFSSDDGKTWTAPQVIQLAGLPDGMRFPFDPTLVPLPDGRVRLYFTGNMGRTFQRSEPAIHSAISNDGVNYTYEPGVRFNIEGRITIDCAVALHQGVFHLFVPCNGVGLSPGQRPGDEPEEDRPREGVGYHATSDDGLNFTRVNNVLMDGRRRWLGNAESDGKRITFYGTGEGLNNADGGRPRGAFWMATSEEGKNWKLVANPSIGGGDPGAVKTHDGGLLVVITGESRRGPRGMPPNQPLLPKQQGPDNRRFSYDSQLPISTQAMINQQWSRGRAEGNGPVKLQNFPLKLDDIGTIIPMGNMQSGHTTPSDHLYLVPKGATNQLRGNIRGQGQGNGQPPGLDTRNFSQLYDVIAVADGFFVMLQWRPNPQGGQARFDPTVFDRAIDLKVFVEHSSTMWSYVDHLVEVDPAIMQQVPGGVQPGQPVNVRIPIKAGQRIGKVGNQTFDFALIDTSTLRKGFIKPEQFLRRDPHKPHLVDPFEYVDEPLRSQLLAKNARKVAPFGGRVDFDIDGKLIGNWYEEGTGGYAGLNRRIDYWVGHLSIVYHHLDPNIIVFSIGNYDGRASQFWVKNNQPDPANIGEREGIVKYELIYGQLGSSGQIQKRQDADQVQATALVQVLPEQKLRFEVFPGKTADGVDGFTSKAKVYER